jgi:hypothetical protein
VRLLVEVNEARLIEELVEAGLITEAQAAHRYILQLTVGLFLDRITKKSRHA